MNHKKWKGGLCLEERKAKALRWIVLVTVLKPLSFQCLLWAKGFIDKVSNPHIQPMRVGIVNFIYPETNLGSGVWRNTFRVTVFLVVQLEFNLLSSHRLPLTLSCLSPKRSTGGVSTSDLGLRMAFWWPSAPSYMTREVRTVWVKFKKWRCKF